MEFANVPAGLAARLEALFPGAVITPGPAALRRELGRGSKDRARAWAPAFLEVYVATPLEECRRRDAQGLHALTEANVPGAAIAYERPDHPEVVISPDDQLAERQVASAIFAFRRSVN